MSTKRHLSALIRVLEALKDLETQEEQLSALELLLVGAELNPSPLDFSDIMESIELLKQVSGRESEPWDNSRADLQPFFAKA